MHFLFLSLLLFLAISSFVKAGSNEESKAWLAENAKKDGVVVLPSGLQYKILKKGHGKEHPTLKTPVDVDFTGKFIDGKVFDGTFTKGELTTFFPNDVIAGWKEALQLMVAGDKWELYVPSELGYGDKGYPPKIKGGDAMIFDFELVNVGFGCDPVSLADCDEKEKAYAKMAKREYGSDLDDLETVKEELLVTLRKLGNDGAARDLLQRKIKIIEKLSGYHMSDTPKAFEAIKNANPIDSKPEEEESKDDSKDEL